MLSHQWQHQRLPTHTWPRPSYLRREVTTLTGKREGFFGICLQGFSFHQVSRTATKRGKREAIQNICDRECNIDGNFDISITVLLATWSMHNTVDSPTPLKRCEHRMHHSVLHKVERFH